MIERIIAFSIHNRFLVLVVALLLSLGSFWAVKNTPLDALPDLSPPQVIVQIQWEGQSPQLIDDQGTYPLVSQFLSIADIQTVRGFSSYENGLIYIIFKDKTDLYWARTRVLEQLQAVQSSLPSNMKVTLGPDASGVGWVYEYALTSKSKDLAELRSIQDYYYKYALLGVDGVSEVASIGGFVPSFEVVVDNNELVRYDLSINDVTKVLQANNNDTGGRIIIENGYEWMVKAKGYVKSLDDIRALVVTTKEGVPLTIGQLARVEKVPSNRRGVADLNGQGEVVGGIVMVRMGADVNSVIKAIKVKMAQLKRDDVEVVTTYDRSQLIEGAMATLQSTLLEESIIVVVVIGLFLLHLRSALIVFFVLPLTIGLTFLLMKLLGVGSNIMSLGGIAIAIGAMVDATIVMIENGHKALQKLKESNQEITKAQRVQVLLEASTQVGRPIFFALALVVVSFLPIFALSGQEGLLFTPLAFTKTFAMSAGALLSITIVPVLMLFFLKGNLISEEKNLLNRFFMQGYHYVMLVSFRLKYGVIAGAFLLLALAYPLYMKLNWEFMPMLNEQSVMYMPVTPYGISVSLSKELTQKTDKILASFPEVATVFGKGGRALSATDPAPLGMIETIITFKPQSQWREGMTYKKLLEEMEEALKVPGLVNSWTYPIRGRIDMLLSGIRTPLGIKLYGSDTKELQKQAQKIEHLLRGFELTQSVFADQAQAGYYIDIELNASAMARFDLTKETLLAYTSSALGGKRVSTMYLGIERYPITLRLEDTQRQSIESIENLLIKTKLGFVPLKSFAKVHYEESASIKKSEMATPVTYIYITPKEGITASEYKAKAKEVLSRLELTQGYYFTWAGQSEYLDKAMQKMVWIIPTVLLLIFVLIFLALKKLAPTLIIFFTLPFALLGGLLYVDLLDYSMSIAVVVGFLALLGVASETAIVMMVYLQNSVSEAQEKFGKAFDATHLREAIYEGAVRRVRPKLMTVFAILASLLPIMYTQDIGSEVMQRIAAPMIGGMISSALLSLVLLPLLYERYVKYYKRYD